MIEKKINIAIIGHGFVGKAVDYGFPDTSCNKFIIDPKYQNEIKDLTKYDIDFAFVCVPTPMNNNGSIDSSIIENVLDDISKYTDATIIVKSTVIPDVIDNLDFDFVYNPEFLTENNANQDFVNPSLHVLGGPANLTTKVEDLYNKYSLCKPCPVHHMRPIDASFVKYGVNCFLATKVLWFNQFFDIIEKAGGNFNKIIGAITNDERIDKSHTTVPGFDGKRGYGGACFPKDTNAFLSYAPEFTVLEEVIKQNNKYRKNYSMDSREKEQNVTYGGRNES